MKQKIRLIPSGIPLIDTAWGGLYKGGTYILIGPRKSGRTLISLQYARECVKQKEICLFFTTLRPKELMIHAASINFDLQNYMNQNQVIVVRVSSPVEVSETVSDEVLSEYLKDIVSIVDQYQPDKIVFDELTPFIGFKNLKYLQSTFLQMTESIEEAGITSLFVVGDPATLAARNIVDVVSSNSTGIITLEKSSFRNEYQQKGKIIIIPNIGHTEGKFETDYKVEPNKGIVELEKTVENSKSQKTTKVEKKYKQLSDLEIPEESLALNNFYSYSDFNLLLNTQIALYKSTGKEFSIISFKFDEEAEKSGLISFNQFKDVIRLSADKKDKICVINNKILVLIIKEQQKNILSLIAKVKNNLPGKEENSLKKVMQNISVYAVYPDNSIENSDDLLNELLSEEQSEKKNFRLL